MPELRADDQWDYLRKFPDYVAVLREYTHRTLSRQEDILNAINGVFRTLRPDPGRFICGLPEGYFIQALLWYPDPGSLQSRTNFDMPSWSWAGWYCSKGVSYNILDVRLLRTIMIALRNLFIRLGKALNEMSQGTSSSSSSSSSYNTTSSTSSSTPSSGTGSSSGSSSSSFPLNLFQRKRDWSTLSIAGKATANLASCFGLPLFVRGHTVKELYLCENGRAAQLNCNETLALSTFLEEDIASIGVVKSRDKRERSRSRARGDQSRHHSKLAAQHPFPLLSMKTVIVQFSIGDCLWHYSPHRSDESSVFELLGFDGECVGEVWTINKIAKRGRSHPLDFLTISWGPLLSVAEIAERYIPRWTFDAAKLPESRTFMEHFPIVQQAFHSTSDKSLAGSYGRNSRGMETPSMMAFVEALLPAKKEEPRPKFLWSTVNLILVEWDGPIARRVGMGRVIFKAWLLQWNRAAEVILD